MKLYKFILFFLLNFIFLNAAFSQKNDDSRFLGSCSKRIPSQPIDIVHGNVNYTIDATKDIADLSQMSNGNDLSSVTMGLTVATSSLEIKSKVVFFRPHPNIMCGKIGFNGSIFLNKHIIYIAKEFPKGSCEYSEILEHEILHARINQQNIIENANELGGYLRKKYFDNVVFSSTESIDTKSILEEATDFSSNLWVQLSKRQKEVDRLMTWEAVLAKCQVRR